jgi:uncharacterized protein YeaO (DUF488 family)
LIVVPAARRNLALVPPNSGRLQVSVARVYGEPIRGTARILVDRVWPRGLSKQDARLDEWCKDVAPSTELRRWYGHDPQRFAEFARRYRAELERPGPAAAVEHLREIARERPLVLVTATKDVDISQAAVLAGVLLSGAAGHPC